MDPQESSSHLSGLSEPEVVCGQLRFENRFAIPLSDLANAKDVVTEKGKLFELAKAYYLSVPLESIIENMNRNEAPEVLPPVLRVLRHADGDHALSERIANDLWMRNAELVNRYDGFRLVSKNSRGGKKIHLKKTTDGAELEISHLSMENIESIDRYRILEDGQLKWLGGFRIPVFDPENQLHRIVFRITEIATPVQK